MKKFEIERWTQREDWLIELNELEVKARQGHASRQDHRLILYLRTLLNLLPPDFWWQWEV